MSETALTHSIATRGLNLCYGDFQALKDVTIDIPRGRITAMIGPSGGGKTTLLRCFNRINERFGYVTTTREISVLGHNILDPDVSLIELRKHVGMVFQRPNPLPISVYENKGLSPLLVQVVGKTVRELHSNGISILLVEQKLGFALKYADYIHIINKGRFVCSLSPAELAENQAIRSQYLGV